MKSWQLLFTSFHYFPRLRAKRKRAIGEVNRRIEKSYQKTDVLATMSLVYFLTNGPRHVYFLLYRAILVKPLDLKSPLVSVLTNLGYVNSWANPLIYMLQREEFRQGLRLLLTGRRTVGPMTYVTHENDADGKRSRSNNTGGATTSTV